MPSKMECPECGQESIKVIKRTTHSSRSSFSGGVTFKLLDKKCPECGFEDVKSSLKSKGFHVK